MAFAKRSATFLLEELIKIRTKVTTHARYVVFQMAEVTIPRTLFLIILWRELRMMITDSKEPWCSGR